MAARKPDDPISPTSPVTLPSSTSTPAPSTPSASTKSPAKIENWKIEETHCLLALYAEFKDAFDNVKRNQALWNEISKRMKAQGFDRTGEQCRNRWKVLVRQYKKAEAVNRQSGRRIITFNFHKELSYILGNKSRSEESSSNSPRYSAVDARGYSGNRSSPDTESIASSLQQRRTSATEAVVPGSAAISPTTAASPFRSPVTAVTSGTALVPRTQTMPSINELVLTPSANPLKPTESFAHPQQYYPQQKSGLRLYQRTRSPDVDPMHRKLVSFRPSSGQSQPLPAISSMMPSTSRPEGQQQSSPLFPSSTPRDPTAHSSSSSGQFIADPQRRSSDHLVEVVAEMLDYMRRRDVEVRERHEREAVERAQRYAEERQFRHSIMQFISAWLAKNDKP